MENDSLENIKRSMLFNSLTDKEFEDVISKVVYTEKLYRKNEIIAHEDDYCNTIGIILAGGIEITRLYSNGREVIVSKLNQGDIFGEAIIFSGIDKYPSTIISTSESTIAYIEKKELLKLLSSNEKVLNKFLSALSDKIVILNRKIKNSSFKNIRQRVINYILERKSTEVNNVITLEDSKEKIALYLGIPRPSLSRELMNLRDLGYIDFDRHTIKILNLEAMEEEMFK